MDMKWLHPISAMKKCFANSSSKVHPLNDNWLKKSTQKNPLNLHTVGWQKDCSNFIINALELQQFCTKLTYNKQWQLLDLPSGLMIWICSTN